MATFTSPSWPPDPPVFDGLAAKSSTLVQFAVGACMVFVQHLVQRLGFGGLETGRALMIGNLVPALQVLLTTFGGMTLGIGSTSPVLLLGSGRRRDVSVADSLSSPGFDVTWKATRGIYSRTHSDFDLREETMMGLFLVSGCLVLTLLAGAWIIRARISVTEVSTDAGTTVYGSPLKHSCSDEGSKAEAVNDDSARKGDARTRRRRDTVNSGSHGDERKDNRVNDSDDDSDDDDPPSPPPPPGPGTGLHHDPDWTGENAGWKHLGVTFVLGYLVAAMLKALRKLKTKTGVATGRTGLHVGSMDYRKEWDVLDGTYASSRSKSDIDIDFRHIVGAVPYTEFRSAIPHAAAQNQTPTDLLTHRQRTIRAGMSRIKATVKKARAKFMVAIQICLESFLETFGLVDFAVLVVLPLIISVLRYRYDEQPIYEQLMEANEAPRRPNRREDDEHFVYLDQRVFDAPNVYAIESTPEQINISTPSSPRRTTERYATHYSELAEFIVRHDARKLNGLDGDNKKDVCVESITDEVDNSEGGIKPALAHTVINGYADETDTKLTSFGSRNIVNGDESHTTDTSHNSKRSSEKNLDKSRGSTAGGEFEDAQELLDDLSEVGSYATAEGDVEMEVEVAETESPYSEERLNYIDDNYVEDEIDDTIRLFPGSFPVPFQPQMLGQIPIWGTMTRSNRWSIFAQFDELRAGGPLLASEAIDFGLPRSSQTSAAVDSFRTPPRASAGTTLSALPAVPRRKMRLEDEGE